ncbi:cupin domain-containing protein [Angustibacter luteus]|uniref:Cupin domain-containing protein n=1 Tax=Angustibacter luteus TaxID=658456 RepID=A0ABW1JEC8_9ACTN
MRIVTSVQPTSVYGGNFTGDVRLSMLSAAAEADRPDVAMVSFDQGAVTCWHEHPGGQLIWVVSGLAVVGTDEHSEVLQPGSLVEAPAGERHWHGAAAGEDAVLLCFTWGTTSWTDAVPERSI